MKIALLWNKLDNNKVQCNLCAHRCIISENEFGICDVRQNVKGDLYTHSYGKIVAKAVDPIEKKPIYHFLQNTKTYSVAALGCNLKCSFCQNWTISQIVNNKDSDHLPDSSSADIVSSAIEYGCKSISYTYTEPTIFFEFAFDTSRLAKDNGLYNIFVTNGYMTKDAIEMIGPYLDAANVDLKAYSDEFYQNLCGGKLKSVLDSIRHLIEQNVWIEITTLLIPGKNDSEQELSCIAEFIAGVDLNIPWHISRYHPDYKYLESLPTPIESLEKARYIGMNKGLKNIYLGNV